MSLLSAPSLRRRLLFWLLASTAVIGVVALADTWREAVETANAVSDRVLAGSALAIAERVVVTENGNLEVDIPYVALEMLTSAAQDRVFYRVDGPPGQFITGYQTLPTVADMGGQATAYRDAVFRGEQIRIAVLQRSASTGINSVPFAVTVAAGIVWIAVTVSLRPLHRLGEAIALRNPDDLHPIEQRAPSEVQGLVETVNSFMVRLQSALDALRHFSGNASHQLRTPMAIVRTQLALAGRASSLAEVREAVRKGDEAVAHAERILAQLLLMAKIDAAASGEPGPPEPVDVAALARELTADRVPAAAEAGIDLGYEGAGPAMVRAEPLLFGELLRNLLENAIAYAGRGAEVTASVRTDGGAVLLRVEDNGPGIAPDRLRLARERFSRGEHRDAPGMGLGLAIVEEITALFGGTMVLESGAAGRGLRVTIRFPAA